MQSDGLARAALPAGGSWTLWRRRGSAASSVFRRRHRAVAVQCSVRALADGADGVALTVRRSSACIDVAAAAPARGASAHRRRRAGGEPGGVAEDAPPPPPHRRRRLRTRRPGRRRKRRPSGSTSACSSPARARLPPHLSTAHLRAAGGRRLRLAVVDEAYWLGGCRPGRREPAVRRLWAAGGRGCSTRGRARRRSGRAARG